MLNEYSKFESRKRDHIDLALMQSNQTTELNKLDSLILRHDAMPDFDFNEINISGLRFNKITKTPFLVSSMTAGHNDALHINNNLMQAAVKSGWEMGVGSQRRELTDDLAKKEWQILRKNNPNVVLYANLGISQLISSNIDNIHKIIDIINANGIIIHCNPLQECIQPEGTPFFKGSWHVLESLKKKLDVPVIVKETGCGFSLKTLQRFKDIGVDAVDVSGLGGTHWGRIEGHRADENSIHKKASVAFKNWGIDTVTSVMNAASLQAKFEIWGSGGVRHGLDAAKLIALGATTVGFAKPLLKAALISAEKVFDEMQSIEYELKVAMFCTGSRELSNLKESLCL
jgi:isopentenyl-diphosphate delta-isomerase